MKSLFIIEEDDDEPEEIDPALKAKLYPMAMRKAKKTAKARRLGILLE